MVVIVNGSGDVTENSGMVTLTPRALLQETDIDQLDPRISYPVVIISCVHYLGPPGPFSFPDSRDLLEVLGGPSWQRERPQGGSPRVREDPLGTHPLSLCQESL